MEKFTTFEQAIAYLDCADHYFNAIQTLGLDARVKREILSNEFIWTCDRITKLDYSKITDDEFNAISDAYEAFRAHYHEICK